jgi:hypothetical protein
MEFANQRFFDLPSALLEARGADRKQPVAKADGTLDWVTNGGIIAPQRHEIATGTRLVRFGNITPHFAVAGGWWLEFSAYRKIEDFADRYKMPVQVALRLLCCVPPEWSQLTVLMQAHTIAPLLAYRGSGAPVTLVNKTTKQISFMAVTADASGQIVPQLFIPGTASRDLQRDAILLEGTAFLPAETAFKVG